MRLTDDQFAGVLRRAGFAGSALINMLAVGIAESSGDTDAEGDKGLRDAQWGPSVGLTQIRSLNAQRGTGGVRDEIANHDPNVNAAHAFVISGGGTNLQPWSTWLNGAYRQYVTRAQAAVSRLGGGAFSIGIGGATGTPSASAAATAPGLSGGAGGSLFDAFYRVSIFATLALGGVALVVLGGWRSVSPGARQGAANTSSQAVEGAKTAAKVAAL